MRGKRQADTTRFEESWEIEEQKAVEEEKR